MLNKIGDVILSKFTIFAHNVGLIGICVLVNKVFEKL